MIVSGMSPFLSSGCAKRAGAARTGWLPGQPIVAVGWQALLDLTRYAATLPPPAALPAGRAAPVHRLPATTFPRSVARRARRGGVARSPRHSMPPGQPRAIFYPLLLSLP